MDVILRDVLPKITKCTSFSYYGGIFSPFAAVHKLVSDEQFKVLAQEMIKYPLVFGYLKEVIQFCPSLDLNEKRAGGKTLLHSIREKACFAYLIENGADMNIHDDAGVTPLMCFLLNCADDASTTVVTKESLAVWDNDGNNALYYWATGIRFPSTFPLCYIDIKREVNIFAHEMLHPNKHGDSAFMKICKNSRIRCEPFGILKYPVSLPMDALCIMLQYGSTDIVRGLFNHIREYTKPKEALYSPYHAFLQNNVEDSYIIRDLEKICKNCSKNDLETVNGTLHTPLSLAAENPKFTSKFFEFLVRNYGMTCPPSFSMLRACVQSGKSSIVDSLFVNTFDTMPKDDLFLALRYVSTINKKIEARIKEFDKQVPSSLELIVALDEGNKSLLTHWSETCELKCLQWVVKRYATSPVFIKAFTDFIPNEKSTCLHKLLGTFGDFAKFKKIFTTISKSRHFDKSALNRQDKNGNSLLHIVAGCRITEFTQLIVDSGIDQTLKNNEGKKARDCACSNRVRSIMANNKKRKMEDDDSEEGDEPKRKKQRKQ